MFEICFKLFELRRRGLDEVNMVKFWELFYLGDGIREVYCFIIYYWYVCMFLLRKILRDLFKVTFKRKFIVLKNLLKIRKIKNKWVECLILLVFSVSFIEIYLRV